MRLVDEETNEGGASAERPASLERDPERSSFERRIRAYATYVAKSEEYASLLLARLEQAAPDLALQQKAELARVEESDRAALEEQHRAQRESLARFLEFSARSLAAVRQRASEVLSVALTDEQEEERAALMLDEQRRRERG